MNINPIVLSIPVFFILIGVELLVERFRQQKLYRLNDALTNISCGIGEQVTGVFMKLFVVSIYQYIYEQYAIFHIPTTWLTGILLFIAVDFFYYWFHRYSHEINLFWGGHVVHHQSEEYNLSVALRQGWFQKVFSFAFYLPLALIGFETLLFVTVASLVTLYQFWIHTKAIGKLGWLEWVLNTPSHHRVHHGVNPKYIDKNHAGALIIWDRMFGTFQQEEEEPVYGITKPLNSWNPFWANMQHWVDMMHTIKQTPGWADKLRVVFMPPGWRPAYMGGTIPIPEVDRSRYHKYNTDSPAQLNYYVFFQYVCTLIGASLFLFTAEQLPFLLKMFSAALIVLAIVNCGALFEKKKWVYVAEFIRLVASSAFCVYLAYSSVWFMAVTIGIGVFTCISAFWLLRLNYIFYPEATKKHMAA
ncbi:sterol desaturase family protein [Rhodocytophaga rosea]|uniref:Sterol desaturase family protein n=1 Tax=Rhodocytophaga rosea TaxID=2704465 RepID=A0A6C0GHP0_9BACT|nr:sterol desaturase family protein [Rhodocytophaga rosea]QHT67469.1 sterol desaturase family protein [Rhodocytophaga rosea]